MLDKPDKTFRSSNVKNSFRKMFGRIRQESLPFLPRTLSLAAKIEQVSLDQLLSHPEQMSKALRNTKRVIGTDAILVPISFSVPVLQNTPYNSSDFFTAGVTENMLEVIRHLKADQEYVACLIPGPVSTVQKIFAQHEAPDPELYLRTVRALCQGILEITRIIGEARPDLIVIQERKLPESLLDEHCVFELLDPVFATIGYYNAEPILSVSDISWSLLQRLAESAKGIILTQNVLEDYSLTDLSELQRETGTCFGLQLPEEIYFGQNHLLEKFCSDVLACFEGRGVFACSMDEVPINCPIEYLQIIAQTLRTPFKA
ncbi:MAG: hypothetical protein APF81_21545 [Desulfosporosinus sp. BRH_c37]|nr:MAG: hypothetical protein APF81_21545 [Desulfosporosinus sp. BRH_c37]